MYGPDVKQVCKMIKNRVFLIETDIFWFLYYFIHRFFVTLENFSALLCIKAV